MSFRKGLAAPLFVSFAILMLAYSAVTATWAEADAQRGQVVFKASCTACHSIGGGKGVGPDLKGVTQLRERTWLARFILEPDKVLAENDLIAVQLLKDYNNIPMPNMGLSAADVASVIDYLDSVSGQPPAPTPTPVPSPTATTSPTSTASTPLPTSTTPTPPPTSTTLTPTPVPSPTATPLPTSTPPVTNTGDVQNGRGLFTGAVRFSNGGPACMACHDVVGIGMLGGGFVGPDLTGTYQKFGGPGLAGILASLPFPTMRPIYEEALLTAQEQADMAAFLANVQAPGTKRNGGLLAGLVVGGFVALAVLAQLLWRRRLRPVRAQLVQQSQQVMKPATKALE